MTELVTYKNNEGKHNLEKYLYDAEIEGRILYNDNSNYQNLANLMEHPEFRKMYDTHFTDKTSIQNILMFMKLYKNIENSSPVGLTGYQKLSVMDRIWNEADIRREIISNTMTDNLLE